MKCVGVIFQVRLPRQQLYVCRVSPKTTIQQILDQVCREKGYDPARYEVRKTGIIPFYNKHLILKTRGHARFARSPLVIRLGDSGYGEVLSSGWHYNIFGFAFKFH